MTMEINDVAESSRVVESDYYGYNTSDMSISPASDGALDGNVQWNDVICDILVRDRDSINNLAQRVELDPRVILAILDYQDTSGLNFRAGANLLDLYFRTTVN